MQGHFLWLQLIFGGFLSKLRTSFSLNDKNNILSLKLKFTMTDYSIQTDVLTIFTVVSLLFNGNVKRTESNLQVLRLHLFHGKNCLKKGANHTQFNNFYNSILLLSQFIDLCNFMSGYCFQPSEGRIATLICVQIRSGGNKTSHTLILTRLISS